MDAAAHFESLFPPLLAREPAGAERGDDAVDIATDSLQLPPLEKAVELHVYNALHKWNAVDHVSHEATLPYMPRLRKYRAIVRWILYENEDTDEEEEQDPTSARQRSKQRKRRRQDIAKYQELFATLPPIHVLEATRQPSDRMRAFVAQFPSKKPSQVRKRSVADTQTAMCFEFARRPIRHITRMEEEVTGEGGGDREEEEEEKEEERRRRRTRLDQQQRPTATSAATWSMRTLLASASEDLGLPQPTTRSSSSATTTPTKELLLWMDVLHPTKDPARTQSFLVRGSQSLSDVVDLVVCAYDQRLAMHDRQAKLLYFDKQFYIDRRHNSSADYSKQILDWIQAKPSRVAKYLTPSVDGTGPRCMSTTTFADLPLKIDLPGVYIHQGECEHLVRLRDARLTQELDSTNRENDFPMRLPNLLQRQVRSCFVCTNYSAKFVTYGDRLGTSDPMFYCERCYKTAHYDPDGKLRYDDFQVFPYIQD